MNASAHPFRTTQHGVALLIGLVLLIVLSIMAMVAMQLVSSQNRVASSAWNAQMSLATGEGALGSAETALLTGAISFATDADGDYVFDSTLVPVWAQTGFDWSGNNVVSGASFANGVAFANTQFPQSKAEVVVEQLPAVVAPGQSMCVGYSCNSGNIEVFRVTAHAVGPDGKLPVLVQDTSEQ